MIDLKDFYSAGYFLIRRSHPGWTTLQQVLLPPLLLSLSSCLSPQFNLVWGMIPGDREGALKFGIPEQRLDECIKWCGYEYEADADIWGMFYSLDAARRFIQRFELPTEQLYLIETGLPVDIAQRDWHPFFDQKNDYGIEKRIAQKLPMEDGGEPLGFEVVSFQYSGFSHSWLCSGLHQDMADLFGIRPNGYGLIDTLEDALKVYEWIKEDEMKGTRAEPEPYDVWLLVSHALDS